MPRYIKTCEPIDDFLASQGLTRKIIAKDGSCLFRAVAEQVFHTQALHNDVRQACIRFMERNSEHFEPFVEGPFDHHLFKLQNAKEWAGQVEISALSLMYKRDFIIYQDPGKPPNNVTQNGYPDKVLLCFSNNNHYDSIFTKKYQSSLAVCQSIVYEILYKRVFNIAKEADEAVEILRCSPGKKPHRHYGFQDGPNSGGGNQRSPRRHEEDERDRFGRLRNERRRPPLPYKVAKALDPEIYRNVEYDCWNEGNKEQMHQDFLLATGLQFCPGDKVQVRLDDSSKWYNAHIQEVKADKGPITVFIEDLGEKHEIPIKNVKPHPSNPPRSWSVVGGRGGYKNQSGYHQKYANGVGNGADYRGRGKAAGKWGRGQGMVMLAQSFPPGPGGEGMGETPQNMSFPIRGQPNGTHKGARAPSPFRATTPPPRFVNRGMEGHPEPPNMGRGRSQGYHGSHMMQGNRGGRTGRMYGQGGYPYEGDVSSEELDERKTFEDSIPIYELDQGSFPSLSSNCGGHGGPVNPPAQFWSKMRKDGRRSISPQQRMDTPSPHLSDKRGSDPMENILPGQFQEMVISSQDQRVVDASCMERHYSPISALTDESMMHPSSPSLPKSATPSSLSISPSMDQQTGSPPTIAPAGYVPPMAMGVPFYHLVIPMSDWNIPGQVNFGTNISRDPNGSDLPMTDVSTLRFFYNLGTEYYRRLCMIQQLQQQQCYQLQATGPLSSPHQPPQQHGQPHGTTAYTQMVPHPPGMGMMAPPIRKHPYDVGGGVTMVGGGGGGGQEEEEQPDGGQVNYDGTGPVRSFSPGYMSEPIPISSTGYTHPTTSVYNLPSPCSMAGDPYVNVAYHSPTMQLHNPVQGNQMGMPPGAQNQYMYPQPVPMGYASGKVQPHPTPLSYSPNNPITYVQMTSPAAPQPQLQQHHPHQQQTMVAPATSQGSAPVTSGGGQYTVQHSTSAISNSSCSSQDSGILSSSPPQAPYATNG